VVWRAVRRKGGSSRDPPLNRLREADGLSHVPALAFQSMFVLLSGFIGQVGLASAFDLPRVRGIIEEMAATLSPGPSGLAVAAELAIGESRSEGLVRTPDSEPERKASSTS